MCGKCLQRCDAASAAASHLSLFVYQAGCRKARGVFLLWTVLTDPPAVHAAGDSALSAVLVLGAVVGWVPVVSSPQVVVSSGPVSDMGCWLC